MASDRFGRRKTLIVCVIMEVFTGLMASFLPDYWSFTIVRAILGFSLGGIMVIGFVIVMEYVGHTHRDVVSALYHVPFTAGHILLAAFGYLIRDFVYFQLAISLSTVILLSYICVLPESPRWLLAVNKTTIAVKQLKHMAKINKLPVSLIDPQIELYQLQRKSHIEKKGYVWDLFRTPNLRKNILIMSFMWLVVSYYFYGVSYYICHLTGNLYVNVAATGGVCLCACLLAIPLMKFMKRKTVLVLAHIFCSLSLLFIVVIPEGLGSLILGCSGLLFSFIIFVVAYLYVSELFPTVVRNAAVGLASMMARMGAMIAPFVATLRPYGKWCAPVAFGVFPLITAFLLTWLPETKGCELLMTLEEAEEFGFFTLYCPVMYLMFFNHKLYRKVTDLLFALWELYPVALFQCCFKTHLHHFGDYLNPHESTIVILNHRTRVDWNYVWIALYHATQEALKEKCSCKEQREEQSDMFDVGGKSKIKFVLKDELKVVPGLGWIMQLNFFLYVKRAWREDQLSLTQFADYYARLKYPCRLVLFPEGTDLSEDNRTKSHKFADANKLPHYEYVLHPRTTGWAALCSRMRGAGLASVYDVTLAYDTPAQTEVDLLRGNIPRHVYVHVKRYSIQQVPSEDDALRSWINNRWMDKESSLRKFYHDGK
ncbi:hypothetical protein O0L34_g5508 [Tuta absoluta]|nr:hypothetical protein O0L34_g5508 [Tuta absoluta]